MTTNHILLLALLVASPLVAQDDPPRSITENRDDEGAILGYDVGVVDYLTKPVNPAVLRSKVKASSSIFSPRRAPLRS